MAGFNATAEQCAYTCRRCGREQGVDSFPKSKSGTTRLCCKGCLRAAAKAAQPPSRPDKFDFEAYRLAAVIRTQNARARALGLDGAITPEEFRGVCEAQRWRCAICSVCLKTAKPSVDHKISLSAGGAHAAPNIQATCLPCNIRKQ